MTVRKKASAMTVAEQQRYISVITTLNSGSAPTAYGTLVGFHADMSHNMYGSMGPVGRQRFLAWHRDFLLKLEQQMQAVDTSALIPYWNWSVNRALPPWIVGFTPTVKVPAVGGMPGMGGMGSMPAKTVKVNGRRTPRSVCLPPLRSVASMRTPPWTTPSSRPCWRAITTSCTDGWAEP